jgi:nanoRNase/pAp phosphatase (c-di-AMP/oligoRNAs hydrolase)
VASMVAFGLIASKLSKRAYIYICGGVHEQFSYLLKICHHNSIGVLCDDDDLPRSIQTVVAMDTPKPGMLDESEAVRRLAADPSVLRIEIDHHLGTDAAYFGDEGYRLVTTASSASELVGYLAIKMDGDPRFSPSEASVGFLTRNLVLAVLTGIIADSRMGKYLQSKHERWFYERFSSIFDRLLAQTTNAGSGNFASKEEVFNAIVTLTSEEEECYRSIMSFRGELSAIEYVIVPAEEIEAIYGRYGEETAAAMAKGVADALAEEAGSLGLVAYPDPPSVSGFLQFRLRRSHSYREIDLRDMIAALGATNGGGHPGAVGFRFEKSAVPDFEAFALSIARKIDEIASAHAKAG